MTTREARNDLWHNVPWFFRRAPSSNMHHLEVISQIEDESVEQLGDLIAAASQVDGHDPIGEHKYLRMRHGDDLAIGFMAYEAGRLVGYAHTLTFGAGEERRLSCEMVVHPESRGQGIGRALMTGVIRHAESVGARRIDLWAYNDSGVSRAVADSFAFQPLRSLLHMHRHPGPPPITTAPQGTRIRPFRPDTDGEAWLTLNNRIFEGHPENGAWILEDFQARARQPWFRPDDLLLLEVDGALAGFCWLKVEERGEEGRVGEIYIIGTLARYHGRGLGRYLLAEGLRHLSEREVSTVAVYVDQANERAVALYWSFEFHHHHADVCYTLPIPAPAAPAEEATTAKPLSS